MDKQKKLIFASIGCLATIVIWGISGKIAWEWTKPETFLGGQWFTVVWTLLAMPFRFAIGFVMRWFGIKGNDDKDSLDYENINEEE